MGCLARRGEPKEDARLLLRALRRATTNARTLVVSLLRVAACLAALGGCGGSAPLPAPNLILIVIDTLRADHLGAYGYTRPTSPNIDRLAARGVLFENATAPSSWTRPSVGSLFTSRRPSEHGAVAFDRALRGDLPTLAERLRDAGYRTVGISGNFVHVNEEVGLARGFEVWKTISIRLGAEGGDPLLTLHVDGSEDVELRAPRADEVNAAVLARVPPPAGRPLFLYVHYTDPHPGYLPLERFRTPFVSEDGSQAALPPATSAYVVDLAARQARLAPAQRRRLIALYDAEIAEVDDAIGELLEALAERGYGDNTVIAVASDHGEEFAEHQGWFHGLTLHQESISVPIIIYDSRSPGGVRRKDAVDLLDVPTTLLGLAGLESPPGMRGRTLLGARSTPNRDIVAELHPDPVLEEHLRPREQRLALTRWPWKLIVMRNGDHAFYRLDEDPSEAKPLHDVSGEIPDHLVTEARKIDEAASQQPDSGATLELNPETRKGLRALGYAD